MRHAKALMGRGFHTHADFTVALGAIDGAIVRLGEALAPLALALIISSETTLSMGEPRQPRHDANAIVLDVEIVIQGAALLRPYRRAASSLLAIRHRVMSSGL